MTYQEFQRHLGKAGLTITEFAELIRMNRVSISNLSKRGEVPTHLAVIACLLGEMAEREIDFRPVISGLGLEPRKPRGAAAPGRFGGSAQRDLFVDKPTSSRRKTLLRGEEQSKNKRSGGGGRQRG